MGRECIIGMPDNPVASRTVGWAPTAFQGHPGSATANRPWSGLGSFGTVSSRPLPEAVSVFAVLQDLVEKGRLDMDDFRYMAGRGAKDKDKAARLLVDKARLFYCCWMS